MSCDHSSLDAKLDRLAEAVVTLSEVPCPGIAPERWIAMSMANRRAAWVRYVQVGRQDAQEGA